MKKLISLLMVVAMVAAFAAGCAQKPAETPDASTPEESTTETTEAAKAPLEGTMEEIINQIVELKPVEFMAGQQTLDLTDTSEEGLWAIKSFTGLDDASKLKEAAVFEPMMGSMAFSMTVVRVNDAADAKAVAEAMKAGIDPRKWICVQADEVMAVGYGDVVMFIMVDSNLEMHAQDFVDAFQTVCGAELDFILK